MLRPKNILHIKILSTCRTIKVCIRRQFLNRILAKITWMIQFWEDYVLLGTFVPLKKNLLPWQTLEGEIQTLSLARKTIMHNNWYSWWRKCICEATCRLIIFMALCSIVAPSPRWLIVALKPPDDDRFKRPTSVARSITIWTVPSWYSGTYTQWEPLDTSRRKRLKISPTRINALWDEFWILLIMETHFARCASLFQTTQLNGLLSFRLTSSAHFGLHILQVPPVFRKRKGRNGSNSEKLIR